MAKVGNNFVWFTLDKLSQADICLLFTYGDERRCCPLKCKFTLLTVEAAQPCVGDFSPWWQPLFQTAGYDVHTSCSSIPTAALGMVMRGGGQPIGQRVCELVCILS